MISTFSEIPVTHNPSSESSKMTISTNFARLPSLTILIPNLPSSFKSKIDGDIL